MLGLKLGLDTEIAVYKALLDTEEDRVARKNLLEKGRQILMKVGILSQFY